MRSILLGGYMHSDQSLFRSVSAPLQLRSGTVDMLTLITRRTYVQARHQGTPRLFGVRCCELSSPSVTIRVMPSATAKQAWPAGNARIILGSSSYSRQGTCSSRSAWVRCSFRHLTLLCCCSYHARACSGIRLQLRDRHSRY